MIDIVPTEGPPSLDDYASYASLAPHVQELRTEALALVPKLHGRRVWMLSATRQGGGIAEMMPRLVSLLQELGVDTRWVVLRPGGAEFFRLTKRIHNLIHGTGAPVFGPQDRELYDAVSTEGAEAMSALVREDDVIIAHDPQPAGVASLVQRNTGAFALWRCHIGVDEHTRETRAAWHFLEPWLRGFDHAVFTAPEYIPEYLSSRASIIHPAIDPLGPKNESLSPHRVLNLLCASGLHQNIHPIVPPKFRRRVMRLQPDGSWGPATEPEEIGLLYRTSIVQVSRWDRLKGFSGLLQAFSLLKQLARSGKLSLTREPARRIEVARLVLAGPAPSDVDDDPEAEDVLREMADLYQKLNPATQRDIILLSVPLASRTENAHVINALQRSASVVVQNSLREGFGLTVTEAMFKRVPVLTSNACGLRQQVRDGVDGRTLHAGDPDALALTLMEMLNDPYCRHLWGRNAEHNVVENFLVFTQVRRWLEVLTQVVERRLHHA